MLKNIYGIPFIIIALFLFHAKAWSANSFDILIKIDSSINPKNIRIEYFDGKNKNIVSDNFSKNILRLHGVYYSEYVTFTISIINGVFEKNKIIFFVNNHPAKICLSQENKDHETLLKYHSLKEILPAFDTVYNRLFKELSTNRRKEVASMNNFWKQNSKGPTNDSLHRLFKKITQALNDNTISFLQNHSNSYYSFWFFKNQIVDFSLTFLAKDTAYLRSLLVSLKSIFPKKFIKSFEGIQLINRLKSYVISPPKEGQTAPPFVAKDVEDNDVDLNKLNGKYILLDFWATWCGPCMAAVPLVKKLRANFSSDSLVIIGINKDNDFNKFKKEIEQSKMNWRQIFDNKNIISSLYGVTAIPVTLLINKHGVIIYRSLGLSINNEKQIESFLKNN